MKISMEGIIIFVQDVPKLKRFYINNLGLQLVEETDDGGWVLLGAGQCTIGLHKIGQGYAGPESAAPLCESNTKLVFEVGDDLAGLRDRLLQAGVLLRELKTFPNYGFWICDGEDPEGNVFQLRQRK